MRGEFGFSAGMWRKSNQKRRETRTVALTVPE